MVLTTRLLTKSISGWLLLYNTYVGLAHQHLRIIEAALESMKQNKYNDLEVSDLKKKHANVDELVRHMYYTAKAIRL
jgi:radical SAM superfamily enzyme YgiQ (UPF0313 family)